MDTVQIIILSFVQALTEFLPVSSSGHLILIPRLFGWGDQGLEMDVAVHLGTLFAVFLFFWRELLAMICQTMVYIFSGFKSDRFTDPVKLAFVIIIATIPAIVFGLILKKYIVLPRSTTIIGISAILFGILLYIADRLQATRFSENQINFSQGFLIGLAQAVALIPGTSRSGICMTAARFLGFDRVSAARFAFLLSIPSILGAAVLTGYDAWKEGQAILGTDLALAVLSSFIFGMMAIKLMMTFIARYSLTPFVLYRIVLGVVLLVFG